MEIIVLPYDRNEKTYDNFSFQTWYLHYGDKSPLVYLTIWGLLATMFAIGLSIGVIIAVWMLFIIQVSEQGV